MKMTVGNQLDLPGTEKSATVKKDENGKPLVNKPQVKKDDKSGEKVDRRG